MQSIYHFILPSFTMINYFLFGTSVLLFFTLISFILFELFKFVFIFFPPIKTNSRSRVQSQYFEFLDMFF